MVIVLLSRLGSPQMIREGNWYARRNDSLLSVLYKRNILGLEEESYFWRGKGNDIFVFIKSQIFNYPLCSEFAFEALYITPLSETSNPHLATPSDP